MRTGAAVNLEDVRCTWGDGAVALDGVSFRIEPGERVALLGANGSGKTTLLKLLNALVLPDSGVVRYDGQPLTPATLSDDEWTRRFRSETALLFQSPEAMLFNPTVHDEIAYTLRRRGDTDAEQRARAWAERLGLGDAVDKPPYTLSGGEKQRLVLAAVLALEPRLLLLDEPSASLDPVTVHWLVDYLRHQSGMTVVTASHNLALATELSERAIVMGPDHRLRWDGPSAACVDDPELLASVNLAPWGCDLTATWMRRGETSFHGR